MTTTTTTPAAPDRWDYGTAATTIGRDPARFPHDPNKPTVIGEIKPHNRDGIRGGINQLRRHYDRHRGKGWRYQLVTYRQDPKDATRYDVLVADPVELGQIVRSAKGAGRPATWYRLPHQVVLTSATRMVPLWTCPPLLGNLIEPKVRSMYQGWMRTTHGHGTLSLKHKSSQTPGADFTHELAEFLRELATELELEAETALSSSAEAGW